MRSILFLTLAFALNASAALVNRQFPHLIIPVDKREPDRAFGTQKEANIQHTVQFPNAFSHNPPSFHPLLHLNGASNPR